jgi:hypothetical protein
VIVARWQVPLVFYVADAQHGERGEGEHTLIAEGQEWCHLFSK